MGLVMLFGLSAAVHGYVGLRLVPALAAWPWAAWPLAALLVASALVMPAGLLTRRLASRRWAQRLAWAGMGAMGLFSSLFVLTVLRDVVLLGAAGVQWLGVQWASLAGTGLAVAGAQSAGVPETWLAGHDWRALEPGSAMLVPAVAGLVTLLGLANARRTAAIVPVDVPIADLPAPLHGFTIAQISDIHVGPTIRAPYLDAIVRAVNRLRPDLVAVTGDLVDGSVAELREHVAPIAGLASRHGTFFVTGNHEYYSGAHAWLRELERLGVRVLMNEHVLLAHDSATLALAGVADPSAHHFDPAHRSDPHKAIAGVPAHASVRVLLAHQPRSAFAAAQAGFHLQLSGHTHGGQFLPWNLLVRLQQPFTAGLNRLAQLWVYTSRGTGYWGPPKRFGAPSEITLLRLMPA
jgi:predicted MPP superfamily phosphohydrolase